MAVTKPTSQSSPEHRATFHPMKEKKIIKAIRIVWESLDTHLDSSADKRLKGGIIGSPKFHKKCVREYAEVIKILSDLL